MVYAKHLSHLTLPRYLLVGATAASVYVIASNLADMAGAPVGLSSAGARILSIIVAFHGHAFFTFGRRRFNPSYISRFITLWVLNLFYVAALSALAVNVIGTPYWIASLIVIVTTPVINYPAQKFWVFRPMRASRATLDNSL